MQTVDEVVLLSKALADPTRVRLLSCLASRELCVCELVHLMDVGQPAVSRHLRILTEAGLVAAERDGQFINYRVLRPARTAFGEAALAALTARGADDPELNALRERSLTVDRKRLRCDGSPPAPSAPPGSKPC